MNSVPQQGRRLTESTAQRQISVSLSFFATYCDARKLRGGWGHLPGGARRALPLKRRSG